MSAQRRRIFVAMASATAAKGYARTTVGDVIAAARVSRETFYEQFRSKQHCFEEAFEWAEAELFEDLAAETASLAPGPETRAQRAGVFEQLLGAYLGALAAQPALARMFLVEVYAAGPGAIARRARAQARFVDAVAGLLGLDGTDGRFAADALVAAVSSMVAARLAAGDAEDLTALREPFGRLVRRALSR